jgi:coenzyme F420 biosynthesis associated uncharacterized protein
MSTVDWPLAAGIARRIAGRYPLEGTYHETRLRREAPELVARASALVAEETGLVGDGTPDVAVVSRSEWVETNIGAFATLLAPAEERLGHHEGIGAALAGRVMGTEIGAVLGFLSKRVLGQYELVLPSPDREFGDTVLFVGANLLALEREHAFRPSEFRFWVALHECTHRLQFVGVPWLRPYFLSLVEELVSTTKPEPGRIARVRDEMKAASESGRPLVDDRGIFGLFATPDQRQVLDRVQALMSLLEGHGHVVMDRIGARELVTQKRMSEVLRARRKDARTALLFRLIGMEMKLKQYELGERFILTVEREAGWSALDAAWKGQEQLPTLDEINHPLRWLDRVA